MGVDKKDLRILAELDKNCRLSNSQIAKKVGCSKEVVQYRIKRMEREKVIGFYYVIVDNMRLGFSNFRFYVAFQKTTPEIEQEMVDFFSAKKNLYMIKLTQPYDLAFTILSKSELECEALLDSFLSRYGQYIKDIYFSVFTQVEHYPRKYLAGKHDSAIWYFGEGKSPYDADELDLRLLRMLGKNARMPTTQLAKRLGISVKTVRQRMKRLEQAKVLQAYRAMIDMRQLGRRYFKIDVKLIDRSERQKLVAYVRHHMDTVYIDRVLGGYDFEFEVEVQNREAIGKILDEIKRIVKIETIRYYEFQTTYGSLTYV